MNHSIAGQMAFATDLLCTLIGALVLIQFDPGTKAVLSPRHGPKYSSLSPDIEEELTRVKAQIEALKARRDALAGDVNARRDEASEGQAQPAAADEVRRKLVAEYKETVRKLAELEQRLEHLRAKLEQSRPESRSIAELRRLRTEAQVEHDRLSKLLAQMNSEDSQSGKGLTALVSSEGLKPLTFFLVHNTVVPFEQGYFEAEVSRTVIGGTVARIAKITRLQLGDTVDVALSPSGVITKALAAKGHEPRDVYIGLQVAEDSVAACRTLLSELRSRGYSVAWEECIDEPLYINLDSQQGESQPTLVTPGRR